MEMQRYVFLFPVLLLCAGCFKSNVQPAGGTGGSGWINTEGGAGSETACDPLAGKPITTGAIVGVGQDAAGTFYVDAANGIFVSANGELDRQQITGTGSSGSNQFLFTFEAVGADAASARNLLVNTQGGTAVAMALGPTDSKWFLPLDAGASSSPGITSLAVVPPETVAGMKVVNTPNVVDYLADVSNGDVLLATVPLNEDTNALADGLMIFYGPPDAVAQRQLTAFGESLSGNGTLSFLVGGTTYVLTFGMILGPDAGPFGTFALEGLAPGSGATLGTTLRSPTPSSLPSGLSFTCLP
jgi:hypothetical protein